MKSLEYSLSWYKFRELKLLSIAITWKYLLYSCKSVLNLWYSLVYKVFDVLICTKKRKFEIIFLRHLNSVSLENILLWFLTSLLSLQLLKLAIIAVIFVFEILKNDGKMMDILLSHQGLLNSFWTFDGRRLLNC